MGFDFKLSNVKCCTLLYTSIWCNLLQWSVQLMDFDIHVAAVGRIAIWLPLFLTVQDDLENDILNEWQGKKNALIWHSKACRLSEIGEQLTQICQEPWWPRFSNEIFKWPLSDNNNKERTPMLPTKMQRCQKLLRAHEKDDILARSHVVNFDKSSMLWKRQCSRNVWSCTNHQTLHKVKEV